MLSELSHFKIHLHQNEIRLATALKMKGCSWSAWYSMGWRQGPFEAHQGPAIPKFPWPKSVLDSAPKLREKEHQEGVWKGAYAWWRRVQQREGQGSRVTWGPYSFFTLLEPFGQGRRQCMAEHDRSVGRIIHSFIHLCINSTNIYYHLLCGRHSTWPGFMAQIRNEAPTHHTPAPLAEFWTPLIPTFIFATCQHLQVP